MRLIYTVNIMSMYTDKILTWNMCYLKSVLEEFFVSNYHAEIRACMKPQSI